MRKYCMASNLDKETFSEVAKIMAKRSTCSRVNVGAVIVKNGRIISTGWNGVPSKGKHCCDMGFDLSTPEGQERHRKFSEENEIHAEDNAIGYAGRYGISCDGADIYVTVSPCLGCAKKIITAGITNVFYITHYDRPDINGIPLLQKYRIYVEQIKTDTEK